MVKVMLVGLIGAMSASAAVTGSQVSGDPDVQGDVTPLEAKIAAKHKILVSDQWGGGHRMIFDFGGRKGWIVEPKQLRSDRPWVWTMQWMGAYLNRTAAIAKAGIPIILLYGGQDQTVDPKVNCEVFAERFKAAGGKIDVRKRYAYGHHPYGFEHEDIPRIVEFFK